MSKKYLIILFLFVSRFSWAQCPSLLSAMVNSCGANEGNNEFVIFTTSVTANASTYTLNYGSTNPPTVNNLSGADATVPTGTGSVSTTSGCSVIQVTSPNTSIPAGSRVMFIPASFDQNYNVTSLCNGSAPLYVVFIKTNSAGGSNSNWSTTGTLGNTPSTPRYLQVTYNGSAGCNGANAPVQSYTAAGHWAANTDGNIVFWNNGNTIYLNNGCSNISFQTRGDTTVSACSSFTWHGITYTSSTNTPTYTTINSAGYDSIVTLHLTINNPTSSDTIATACSSFTWHGITYTASTNTPTYTTSNAGNCDSVIHLHLTINNGTYNSFTQTACDTFLWHGITYNASGNYIYNYTNANGCNSADTLHLTINKGTYSAVTQTTCTSYTWHGVTYNSSGNYIYNYTNANGCSSADTLHLNIDNGTHITSTQSACGSYLWNGTTYNTSGIYVYNYTNLGGCSSADTLYLTINKGTFNAQLQTACDNYFWHGNSYNMSGTYLYNYTNSNGCASTDTLHLNINKSNTGDTTAVVCRNFVWYGVNYSSSGNPIHVFKNIKGCDSIVTLHLTINRNDTSVTRLDKCISDLPVIWNGNSFNSSGTYFANFTASNGCDSIAKLILQVKNNSTSATVVKVCATELPYRWNNQSYTQSGSYQYISINAAGCDSIATLNLTVFDECNDIVFPTAFTPNEDGLNDEWGPLGTLSIIYKYELFIYNRWGAPVFISYSPSEKWNGKLRNKNMDAGNYVWFVTYTFNGTRRKQSGNLLLLK